MVSGDENWRLSAEWGLVRNKAYCFEGVAYDLAPFYFHLEQDVDNDLSVRSLVWESPFYSEDERRYVRGGR